MASNFSFAPMGPTISITATPTPVTNTFWIMNSSGGTGTLSLSAGAYAASGIRIGNASTDVAYIQLGAPGQTFSVATTNSMPIFPLTVETFRFSGQNAVGFVCATTVTLFVTPGEGM